MAMKAQTLWHISSEESELRTSQLIPSASKKILASICSLVSLGTERNVAKGLLNDPAFSKMEVPYMKGSFALPISYGYSIILEDEEQRRFHCMHPHASFCQVNQEDLFPIPMSMDPRKAALASNMETALNAVWDAGTLEAKKVLICGYGLIGSLIAHLCHQANAEVSIIEKNPNRLNLAEKRGYKAGMEGQQYEVLFNCSGKGDALQYCIDHGAMEARIIELSFYANEKVQLDLGKAFHMNRLQIISSQVSQIPKHMQANWNYRNRKEKVFQLLQDFNLEDLSTFDIQFEESPAFFSKLRTEPLDPMAVFIHYNK